MHTFSPKTTENTLELSVWLVNIHVNILVVVCLLNFFVYTYRRSRHTVNRNVIFMLAPTRTRLQLAHEQAFNLDSRIDFLFHLLDFFYLSVPYCCFNFYGDEKTKSTRKKNSIRRQKALNCFPLKHLLQSTLQKYREEVWNGNKDSKPRFYVTLGR